MPLLSMSRTTVDMQHDPNIRENLQDSFKNFLRNDTVCFWSEDDQALEKLQKKNLTKIIKHFNQKMNLNIKPYYSLFENNQFSKQEQNSINNYLKSLDQWKICSLETLTINFKSSSIAFCVLN